MPSGATSGGAGETRRSGAILNGTLSGGIDGSIKRNLGLTTEQLSQQWRDAVFKEYLPEVGASEQAKQIAAVSLNEARSKGRLHIAPALSPDGTQIAFFSERDGFSIDMFLADATTGRGQAPPAAAHLEQQLRDLPLPQQPGRLVARRQVPRGDGTARQVRRHHRTRAAAATRP